MKFTESHEWVLVEGLVGTVGITEFAQRELGEVVYVELPEVGSSVKVGEEAAVLESTKAAADIYSPVSGEIAAVNTDLVDESEAINSSPEGEGWLFKVKLSNLEELGNMMDKDVYTDFVS